MPNRLPFSPLTKAELAAIDVAMSEGCSITEAARRVGCSRSAVSGYLSRSRRRAAAGVSPPPCSPSAAAPKRAFLPPPKPSPGALPTLPPAVAGEYVPFQVSEHGHWLILTDLHFPYHDVRTIELAVEAAKRDAVVGVLLNGDIMDCHALSVFDVDPSKPRYVQEREYLLQFLNYLRHHFPNARIIYREGNHEERLKRYLMRKAPELFGFDEVKFESLMRLADFGVEYVGDCRIVNLGKLHTIHGHEFKDKFGSVPVNPARKFFLQAKGNVIGGHYHQPSEHHESTISGKFVATWSIGCGCELHPQYKPLNKWGLGFALVDISSGGEFSVRNMRVMNGRAI